MKPALVVLVLACLALGAGLIIVHQKAESRVQTVEAQNARVSAEVGDIKLKFADLEKLYAVQQETLNTRVEELALASNSIVRLNGELTQSAEQLKLAQSEMVKRQERINALESERDGLTKKMDDLNSSIDNLETQIADTKRKLATSEGDKTFLVAELKRLQTERDTLMREFNDIAALRMQVAKLRDEAAIKQRLEWKRLGIYALQDQKGAERLLARSFSVPTIQGRLDAELRQDGTTRAASTNTISGGANSIEPHALTP